MDGKVERFAKSLHGHVISFIDLSRIGERVTPCTCKRASIYYVRKIFGILDPLPPPLVCFLG